MRWRDRRSPGRPVPIGRLRVALLGLAVVGLLVGCTDKTPSALNTAGPKADVVVFSWWILLGVASAVCAIVISLTLYAAIRRRSPLTAVKSGERTGFVVTFGVAIPAVVLIGTFALSLFGLSSNQSPPGPTRLTVDIVGHRWWWEVRYPKSGAVTANEIHIPVGTPVELRLRTADVIHSFWAPQLMPKIDLLPKRVNKTWIQADKVGRYRGQCAEYCGAEHAHMAFAVVVQPKQEFQAWLDKEAQPAAAPDTTEERRGREVLTSSTCGTCHTVRGTTADGDVGPDLTHVGSRAMLAGETIPNDVGHMSGWVSNSQTVKPGNLMPPQQQLSPDELHAVVTYLQSLK